ncbi:MAG: hypothetical protein VKP57_09460 [Candidatus Sericytochromatia bacterium]|nr:hypothetical protein [Candidatus Sericytochromatia bacterium]
MGSHSHVSGFHVHGAQLVVAGGYAHRVWDVAISNGLTTSRATSGLSEPRDVAVTPSGDVYISDYANHRIRVLRPDGSLSVLAGDGVPRVRDGVGTGASFYYPFGLALDGAGYLYVSELYGRVIRRITLSTGAVQTLAGVVGGGFADGPFAQAGFGSLRTIRHHAGALYVVDRGYARLRKLDLATGMVSTLAGSGAVATVDGTGAAASFNMSDPLAVDDRGYLYVGDHGGLRAVDSRTGQVRTMR